MASSHSPESLGDSGGGGPAQPYYHNYRPIRRINQACNACRKKKSRCSGGRPCRSCIRLSEPCEYPVPSTRARPAAAPRVAPEHAMPAADDQSEASPAVADRLSALEQRLDDISSQLGQLTELTRQICSSRVQPASTPVGAMVQVPGMLADQGTTQGSTPGSDLLRSAGARHFDYRDPFQSQHWAVKMEHLIPDEVMRSAFRDYFKYAHNQPYSFFHEFRFWQALDAGTLPDHLLLAVLAHALRFSGENYFKDRTKSMAMLFANMAWKSIVYLYFQERADADLAAVQTITLLSIYDFTAGHDRHDSAWVKIGLAVRMAQDLRLMMDDPTDLSNAEKEERRRVFWSVYMLDRLASCARARPPAVLEASCHLSLPCEEHLWRADLPSANYKLDDVAKNSLHVGQHPGPPAVVIVLTSILGRCTQCMVQEANIRPRQPPWDPSSDWAAVSSELLTCEAYFEQPIDEALEAHCAPDGPGADRSLAGPLVFSYTLFLLTHCLMNQPFLLRERINSSPGKPPHTFLSRALDSGHEHASRLAHLLRDAKQAGYDYHGSFYGYCMVVAGSIHTIGMSSSRESVRESSAACLSLCHDALEDLSQYWQSCESMKLALKKVSKYSSRYSHLTNPATISDPMDQADRDLMWSVLDYSTMCSRPDNAWRVTRPTSPTSWDPSNHFDIMQVDALGNYFPNIGNDTSINYDTLMMPDPLG